MTNLQLFRVTVSVITLSVMISFATVGFGVGIKIWQEKQRYTTYLEALRTVLECRADHSVTAIDRICGPIPTLESIQ